MKKLPSKTKAHQAVAKARKEGKLKMLPCESCGNEKTLAHHTDYSKPLKIMWLCRGCHIDWHKKNGYPKGTGYKALMVEQETHYKIVVGAKIEGMTVGGFITHLMNKTKLYENK